MKNSKNFGLTIGAIFSIVSFLFTFTIAIPMFSVFPSEFLNQGISAIFPNLPHSSVGMITISILLIIFLVALVFTLKKAKKSAEEKRKLKASEIIIIMLVFYLIVHNLGYYILLGIANFPIDALNTLMGVVSFPFSSVSFVLIGLLIDWYWKRTIVGINRNQEINFY